MKTKGLLLFTKICFYKDLLMAAMSAGMPFSMVVLVSFAVVAAIWRSCLFQCAV